MSLQRAVDRFLAEVREEEERAQNPNPNNNHFMDGANSSNDVPHPDIASGVFERLEHLEREVPRLIRDLHYLQKGLMALMEDMDRLREELDRLRRNLH